MVEFSEELMNENQDLVNNLEQQKRKQEQLKDCSTRQQGTKLQRIRNMLNRNLLRRRFLIWANNANRIADLEDALFLSSKTMRRHKLRQGFQKFKKQVGEAKRVEYIDNKVDWFEAIRSRKAYENCFDAWKSYIRRYKMARKFLLRGIKGVDKQMANEAFSTWKGTVFKARKMVYMENIEELERRHEEHSLEVKKLNHQIEANESQNSHLVSKMKHLNHKIMANFIVRFTHMAVAKGFYTWLDSLKDFKAKRRFLRNTMLFWMKNQEQKAFRTWAENALKSKEQELSTRLQKKEGERRELVMLKESEEAE